MIPITLSGTFIINLIKPKITIIIGTNQVLTDLGFDGSWLGLF